MKLEKIFNWATRHRAFRKWATCQKHLKSSELGKKCHDQKNTSEGKQRVWLYANQCCWQTLKYLKY